MKKVPVDADIFVGQGKEMVNIETIDPKELFEKIHKWSDLSMKGVLCGIFGCTTDPDKTCKICGSAYCSEHIVIHFHHDCHEGIILKEIKDCTGEIP